MFNIFHGSQLSFKFIRILTNQSKEKVRQAIGSPPINMNEIRSVETTITQKRNLIGCPGLSDRIVISWIAFKILKGKPKAGIKVGLYGIDGKDGALMQANK